MLLRDRVDLYLDFALNLLYTIDYYYLDKETLNNDEDIRNHYDWCYNRVCDGFKDEEIYFHDNDELREYYYSYYYYEYYVADQLEELKKYKSFMLSVFNIENPKNKAYVDALMEIYEISEKTINNTTKKEKNLVI